MTEAESVATRSPGEPWLSDRLWFAAGRWSSAAVAGWWGLHCMGDGWTGALLWGFITMSMVECVAVVSSAAPFAFAPGAAPLSFARRTAIAGIGGIVTMLMTDWIWRIGYWSLPALVLLALLVRLAVRWRRGRAREA